MQALPVVDNMVDVKYPHQVLCNTIYSRNGGVLHSAEPSELKAGRAFIALRQNELCYGELSTGASLIKTQDPLKDRNMNYHYHYIPLSGQKLCSSTQL